MPARLADPRHQTARNLSQLPVKSLEWDKEGRTAADSLAHCHDAETQSAPKGHRMKTLRKMDFEYHDGDAERIRQLFLDAEVKREKRNHRYTVTVFWVGVLGVLALIVLVKLYTMGAVVGLK